MPAGELESGSGLEAVFRLTVPWEGHGGEAGPRPSQEVIAVGEDRAEYRGGRRQVADKCHTATLGARQVAPKAGQSGPPCCLSPPQLFATKGLISDSASTLYSSGDKTRYFTQKC